MSLNERSSKMAMTEREIPYDVCGISRKLFDAYRLVKILKVVQHFLNVIITSHMLARL